jgi:hypothetical protein
MKRAFTLVVFLLFVGSVLFVFTGKEVTAPTSPKPSLEEGADSALPTRLVVYYFDMGKDCSTCLNLETYTHETLETHFSEALSSGEIRWETVDVDQEEHGHFVEEFGLYTKSVVLATLAQGDIVAHNNLSRIWELVYDKEAYVDYVRAQVQEALGAAP